MSNIEDLIKDVIGYTEESQVACKDCEFSHEDESRFEDRAWLTTCTRNPDVPLGVSPTGRCTKFQQVSRD